MPGGRTAVTVELEDHIGLYRTNLVKRHPLRGVPRLGEERCAAAQLDQVGRQVPADQNSPRGIGDTPVRVSIVLQAHTILQKDGRRHRPSALPRLRLSAPQRQLCDEAVASDELERAKEFTKGRLRLELESTNGVAFWLTYQELLLGQIRTIDEELALVDAVTVADMQRVAREVLLGPIQMAVIGPFTNDAGFRSAIES